MPNIKTYIHGLILATTPSLFVYPEAPSSIISESKTYSHDFTYDEMIHFIHAIESGELENKCSSDELDRVIQFIAYLAKQGVLPEDTELEKDTQELLNAVENPFFSDELNEYQYMLVPAVLRDSTQIILCKTWIHKKWDQVKKFAKKN